MRDACPSFVVYMKPRLVGINHVALQVDDLEQAVAFYTDLFQPTAVDRIEPHAAFLEFGDQFLALFERGSREEEAHFGLVVDDKQAARHALEEARVEILPGPRLDFRDRERKSRPGRAVRPDPIHEDRSRPRRDGPRAREIGTGARRAAREGSRRLAPTGSSFVRLCSRIPVRPPAMAMVRRGAT